MMRRSLLVACMFAGIVAADAADAQSVTGYGSAVYTTLRSCTQTSAGAPCDGTGPGQRIIQSNLSGGANQQASTTFAGTGIGAGSTAFGQVAFGPSGLPEIRAAATAAGDVRVNSNIYFYQTYSYGGVDPVEFGLAGNVHIVGSTTDGVTDPDLAGTLAGGAILFAGLSIWDADSFFQFTDATSFVQNSGFFSPACGTAGVLAAGSVGQALPGGENSYGFATSGCSGSPLTLNAGQRFVVAGVMQFPVNRGGSIDATHTFTVSIDPALPIESRQALAQNLSVVPSAVPEPTGWALLLMGFGAVGATARRRRAAVTGRPTAGAGNAG